MSFDPELQFLANAAVRYTRKRLHSLETRMRVDLARAVLASLECETESDAVTLGSEEVELATRLATVTLLHAGENPAARPEPSTVKRTAVEELLLSVRQEVDSVIGRYENPDRMEEAVFRAFEKIARLVAPESCTRRLPDGPPCARDGDCPVHGRNRPGQCVPFERDILGELTAEAERLGLYEMPVPQGKEPRGDE